MGQLTKDLEKFKLALDEASDHIVITDADGITIYANKAVEKITGYSRDEIIGEKAGVLWGKKMNLEFYETFWKTIKEKKEVFKGEINNTRKNGENYYAQVGVSPIIGRDGNVDFFVGIERDITAEKNMDKAKSEFVSFASHQLRTPLTSISLASEMLLKPRSEKNYRERGIYCKIIRSGVKEMTDIVETLLNISRIEMGTLNIKPESADIAKFMDSLLKIFALQMKKKKIVLKKRYDEKMPMISIDKHLMKIVIDNLLSNSVKYSPDEVVILVEIRKRENEVVIAISDTGYGIDADQQSKIFDKLFRANTKQKDKTKGTGLGLYMVKMAVEQYGGKIWLESPSNRAFLSAAKKAFAGQKGATFYFTLPLNGMKRLGQMNQS